MHGFVVKSKKDTSKRTGEAYHLVEVCIQNEEGQIGVVTYFLKPHEQGDEDWRKANVGTVIDVELEERKSGLNTFTDVVSAQVIPNAKVNITID